MMDGTKAIPIRAMGYFKNPSFGKMVRKIASVPYAEILCTSVGINITKIEWISSFASISCGEGNINLDLRKNHTSQIVILIYIFKIMFIRLGNSLLAILAVIIRII